ncbi:MAG: hypothetical protein AB7U61_05615 [Methylocystis sp.]
MARFIVTATTTTIITVIREFEQRVSQPRRFDVGYPHRRSGSAWSE